MTNNTPGGVPLADTSLIEEVTQQARSASYRWGALSVGERVKYIRNLRHRIVAVQDEILRTIVKETGKPITEVASQEVTAVLGMLKHAERVYPRWLKERRVRYLLPGFWMKSITVHYEPIGVVAVIGPSNFPFSLPVMQSAAALLCGNCVLLKPSERCPEVAGLIRRLFDDASFPRGVVQAVQGGGNVAERIVASSAVGKVLFTGSCETGRQVAELCARHFKSSVLELGGGSAAIVCDDANVVLAARGIAWSGFYANGRSCIGSKRVYVHEQVMEPFLQQMQKVLRELRCGDPFEPATEMGRLENPDYMTRVKDLIRDGIDKGGSLWTGVGGGTERDVLYAQVPLVLYNASPSMRAMQEDVSGPFMAVRTVRTIEQAVQEVNETRFGLAASVWSARTENAQLIARQLKVGMVWINDSSVAVPGYPWGGVKQSGWGRLFSREAVSELTSVKVVSKERMRTSGNKFWRFPYSFQKLDLLISVNRVLFGARGTRGIMELIGALGRYVRGSSRRR